MRIVICTLLILHTTAAIIPHGVVSRSDAIALCRKWVSAKPPDPELVTPLVKARLALEDPRTFAVLSVDEAERITMFVCKHVSVEVHGVDSIVWARGGEHTSIMRRFRRWHGSHFRTVCLVPGSLTLDDITTWQ